MTHHLQTLEAINTIKKIGSLKEIFLRTKRAFWYVALFSLCMNILMLALPLYSLQVLDRVMSSHSVSTLTMLTIITVICFAFFGLFSLIRAFILTRIGEWLDITLAPSFLATAIARSAIGVNTSASQLHRDIYSVKGFIIGGGITTLFDAPWSIIFILVIYMINPILGFIAVLGCAMLVGMAIVNEYATKKPLDDAQKINLKSLTIAETASKNAEVIEAMGMMPGIVHNWERNNHKNLELQTVANNRANILQSFTRFLRMTLQIAVTCAGGYLALHNEISVGGIIAGSILTGRALAPFEGALGVWKTLLAAREAYNRMESTLNNNQSFRGAIDLPVPKGHLSVENLFYRPPTSERPIIKGISFQINPGESLGIIGPSAAGKSTLARLIMGILPPSHGAVRLDGAEVFKWNREFLGPHVGYLPQEVELFAGTIKDNIARMNPDAPTEKVIEAAQMAGVHEMILRLPKGYETEFSIGNLSLSPGQRQRIGLARALYGRPRFIVLDEPNSNLDGEGERALINSLSLIKQLGITCVVVAHRPSIVANVDKILMLRDGLVEQFGPRMQVLQKYTAPAPVQQIEGGEQKGAAS